MALILRGLGGEPLEDGVIALMVARSLAIETYATLEQSLSRLFGHLSDTSDPVAATVFFRLTNSQSRLAILDRLMRLKHGDQHRPFFNSLVKMLRPMDSQRNEIVHWHPVQVVGGGVSRWELNPPGSWLTSADGIGTPVHDDASLSAFATKCDWLSRATNIFTWVLRGQPGVPEGLHQLCRQPLTYPPPADGLSVRTREAPEAPPQP